MATDKTDKRIALKYGDYIDEYSDLIFDWFSPKDMEAYRWVHNPLISDDSLPQIFQESDSRSVDDYVRPPKGAPRETVLNYVSNFTLSNFDTLENAESAYNRWIEKLSKRKDAKVRIDKWFEKVGLHIRKVNYTPDVAICSPTDKFGHFEVLLAEGVEWESLVDATFEPYSINVRYDEP